MRVQSKRRALFAFLAGAITLAVPMMSSAAVPSVMNFQAILLDDQGQIVPDSTYDIVFTIHTDSVETPPDIAIWTELNTVETSGGLFNLLLGTHMPLSAGVFAGETWLQMRLASSAEPFLPRTRIGTTPYSYRVESIDKSTGGEVYGTLNPDELEVGRSGVPGQLSVIQGSGIEGAAIQDYLGHGLSLTARDDAGNTYAQIRPDQDGNGGYFSLLRSEFNVGFRVDGNKTGTNNPEVRILGSSQSIDLDLSATGSESVVLPVDAIQSSEMFDEPGVASNLSTAVVTIGDTRTNLLSRTIEAPADGFILAIGTTEVESNFDSAEVEIGLTNDATVWPASQHFKTRLMAISPIGYDLKTVTVSAIFPVVAGFEVIQLVAQHDMQFTPGQVRAYDRHLSLLYVPTNYGTVSTPTAGESADVTDITEERLVSARANAERIEREMADMKARLLELERSMTEQESENPQR